MRKFLLTAAALAIVATGVMADKCSVNYAEPEDQTQDQPQTE